MSFSTSGKLSFSSIFSSSHPAGVIHYQTDPRSLAEQAVRSGEGIYSSTGALVIRTGQFTGRSPKDRFIVEDEHCPGINWNDFNVPFSPQLFEVVYGKVKDHLRKQPTVWCRDCYASADDRFRLTLRIFTETSSAALFAFNMFLRPSDMELEHFNPDWTLYFAPSLQLDPAVCGTRHSNATLISFKHKMILIAGTGYTGEIKKSVFTILNYVLPQHHSVLSMHCSANMDDKGDTALFFGLSGTGKTTLSADPHRKLIGDDEHGWSDNNIFNFEGGCYAKTIDLNRLKEPQIFDAIREGALVENTVFYPGTNEIDFSSRAITENTRASYPINHISQAADPSVGNIPSNIFFLTCDAHGILPPISRLSAAQAMYQFISGYTARVAGTEAGVKEPVSTFSACFGAPFMPLHPGKYAALLGEKIRRHKVKVWLVNTGWCGGDNSTGSRINLDFTRAMIHAALVGQLDEVQYDKHPVFGMDIPVRCPGVPPILLYPRDTWKDKQAYDRRAQWLASRFIDNFRQFASGVSGEILAAAPVVQEQVC